MSDPSSSLLVPPYNCTLYEWTTRHVLPVYSTEYQFCKLYTFCLKSELLLHVL